MTFPREPCPTCGPQSPPTMHTTCHAQPGYRRTGCGHALDDHTDGLRCRVCHRECGIDTLPAVELLDRPRPSTRLELFPDA